MAKNLAQNYIIPDLAQIERHLVDEFEKLSSISDSEQFDVQYTELRRIHAYIDNLSKKTEQLIRSAQNKKYSLCSHILHRHREYDDSYDVCTKCGYCT